MQIKAIKTHRITKDDNLESLFDKYLPKLEEEMIIVITSKIVSICHDMIVRKSDIEKKHLIAKEADLLAEVEDNKYDIYLTIKNNILMPSAGIDESNGDDVYILLPKNADEIAVHIWQYLRSRDDVEHLGVLITDSNVTPLRNGVMGIGFAWCGFEPIYSYIDKLDVYGHPLNITKVNILDSLAAGAVFIMGEGDEQTPISIITEAPKISFFKRVPTQEELKSISIDINDDLYAPMLSSVKWVKN